MTRVSNPFVTPEGARRYAKARPNYHPQALAAARSMLGRAHFSVGLDLGCGTGMSTHALAEITTYVLGIDNSFEMLSQVELTDRVAFVLGRAEGLPVGDGACEVVTAAAAFHWFAQPNVLDEVRRVLKPSGAFVVYTDWFTGRLREAPDLEGWMEKHVATYPSPRRQSLFDEEMATSLGFELVGSETFATEFRMDAEQFSEYLLTQSNALHAIEERRTTAEDLKRSILSATSHWFPGSAMFEGQVWCVRSPS